MALAGRLLLNLALTIPLFPWALVTFPQITLVLLGLPPGVTVFLQTHRVSLSLKRQNLVAGHRTHFLAL